MESDKLMLAAADLAAHFNVMVKRIMPDFPEASDDDKAEFYKFYLSAIGGMMCAHLGYKEACEALKFVEQRIVSWRLPAKDELKP